MIKAVKLRSYKGIKEVNIYEFDNINILAGKNNSGKSSILEAIKDKAKCFLGIILDINNFENLCQIYRPLINTSSPSANEIFSALKKFIQDNSGKYLYKDSIPLYVEEFNGIFRSLFGRNHAGAYSFDLFLSKIFFEEEGKFKPCLVDPKRNVDGVVKIDTTVRLSTNGGNLLNHLFYLKNQDPYSSEYENYSKIFDNFVEIADGAKFNILPDKDNNIRLQFRMGNFDKWIDADSCGLGLREILLIVSFSLSPDFNFIQIEEPENHLHPEYQRRLLRFAYSLSDKQFFISTHSNIFLDTSYVDKVFLVSFDGQVCVAGAPPNKSDSFEVESPGAKEVQNEQATVYGRADYWILKTV